MYYEIDCWKILKDKKTKKKVFVNFKKKYPAYKQNKKMLIILNAKRRKLKVNYSNNRIGDNINNNNN